MTNAVSGLEMSMHHSGISFALTAAHGWTGRTVAMTNYPTREYIIRETTYPDATKQELIGELVRCKDCLHNRACEIQYHAQAGDLFFCGAAERKDGGGNG